MADPGWNALSRVARSAGERLHVRSALNPILWLCAIAMPLCISAAYLFRDMPPVRDVFIWASLVPLAVACLGFIGFAILSPDRLQSEDYQLRHESLQLIQQKGSAIPIDVTSLTAIANPAMREFPLREEKS